MFNPQFNSNMRDELLAESDKRIHKMTSSAEEKVSDFLGKQEKAFRAKVEAFKQIVDIKKEFIYRWEVLGEYKNRKEAVRAFYQHCKTNIPENRNCLYFTRSKKKDRYGVLELPSHIQTFIMYIEHWDAIEAAAAQKPTIKLTSLSSVAHAYHRSKGSDAEDKYLQSRMKEPSLDYGEMKEALYKARQEIKEKDEAISSLIQENEELKTQFSSQLESMRRQLDRLQKMMRNAA